MQKRVVLAGLSSQSLMWARSALEKIGLSYVAADLDDVLRAYEKEQAAVAVLGLDNAEAAFAVMRQLKGQGGVMLAVGANKDADTILKAMRAGASEFVVDGDGEDLTRAAKSLTRSNTHSLGRVTTLFPAKGGVGATAIATNLAGELHKSGERVCLVDLDLHFGDVLSFLDLPGSYSIADVLANVHRLDRELLESSITRHTSGVYVLAQSDKLEEAENVKATSIETLLSFLRAHFDRIVVDGVRGFTDITLAALDASDQVFVVLTQDVPAVRNAQRCLEIFRRLGYEESGVHLLLNRYQKSSKLDAKVVHEAIGVPVSATLANDFAPLIRAINRGVLLRDEAPRSRLVTDLGKVAAMLRGEGGRADGRGGVFSLFARRAVADGAQ